MKYATQLFLWMALGLWLAGCGGGQSSEPLALPTAVPPAILRGHETQLVGQSLLVCNDICASRGQCGTLDNQQKVVLLSFPEPALSNYNLLAPDRTVVTISNNQSRQVVDSIATYELPFYEVQLDTGEWGWVAGWCIEQ